MSPRPPRQRQRQRDREQATQRRTTKARATEREERPQQQKTRRQAKQRLARAMDSLALALPLQGLEKPLRCRLAPLPLPSPRRVPVVHSAFAWSHDRFCWSIAWSLRCERMKECSGRLIDFPNCGCLAPPPHSSVHQGAGGGGDATIAASIMLGLSRRCHWRSQHTAVSGHR